ncbi:uncharacterized protein OCT59_010319 [Rhizophagus irregularis]|nr:hypothetical protein RirG_016330 [Rhizophagus irregularis DAOM 197198w]UZO19014.1 hypothetical protein OCT59_010319 [Rhizophagus irregularis]GBC30174.1 G1/S-specific cyclin pas1 [Rhizophagus irregularis DAOM 181602=DAOM 197198]CAB4476292.1 unnamed protein product [Rhizophagus irregularis]
MPIVSTWLDIKPKSIQPSSRPDNKKKNYDYVQNAKIEVSKTTFICISSQNKQTQKIEHENKQQVGREHLSKNHNNKNYNNSRFVKIRYNKKAEDNSTLTPVSSSNLTLMDTDANNACKKVLRTKEIFWNEWNEPDCVNFFYNYDESPTSYYSPQCQSAGQIESTKYSSSYSSTSTQSSCIGDQELHNVPENRNNRNQRTNYVSSTTEENAKREISQYWVTSLYDIYLVTQKFSPSENMHQNYLDTIRYTILSIWGTLYDSEFHYWMRQVLQMSGTNCRIIELALYYLLRFKRCLDRSKVELSYIINYSRFTVSTEPCPENQESIKPLPALISSLIIAWKFFQDENYKTNHWTSFTGYTIEQLNVFERDFLRMVDYNIFIKENSFKQWLRFLHSHMQAICGPGLDVRFAYFLPHNRERINEFIKSLKMLNIEEMERIIRINERHISRGKENERVLNFDDIKRNHVK